MDIPLFNTSTEFSIFIEEMAIKNNWTRLETLSWFCEETGAEYYDVAEKISVPLKEKIYEDACKSYSMPKQTSVKLDDL
jgi:hypothetical protein